MAKWFQNILLALVVAMVVLVLCEFSLFSSTFSGFTDGLSEVIVPVLIFSSPVLLIIIVLLAHRSGVIEPRRRAWVVMSYLEQAVRMNLPLSRLLTAAEASEDRPTARRLRKLRLQLENGSTVSQAIHTALPLIPIRTVGLLAASENTGRLGDELGRQVAQHDAMLGRDVGDETFLRTYPIIMVMVLVFVVTLINVFVIPKFVQIFRDFKTPLPPLSQWFVGVTDSVNFQMLLILAFAAWVLLLAARRIGWLRSVDPTAWLSRSRNYADACHVIANALEVGSPLNVAIRLAASLRVGALLRGKLSRWADGVEAGMPSAQSAETAGMPRLISALTATAQLTAAAEAFRFLSRYYRLKFSRLVTLIHATAIPAMTFFFGGIVAIVVLSLFLPLTALIDASGPYRGLP